MISNQSVNLWAAHSVGYDEDTYTQEHEGRRKTLPHREPAGSSEVPELFVRHTYELDHEAEAAVQNEKDADESPLRSCGGTAREEGKDEEDDKTL